MSLVLDLLGRDTFQVFDLVRLLCLGKHSHNRLEDGLWTLGCIDPSVDATLAIVADEWSCLRVI